VDRVLCLEFVRVSWGGMNVGVNLSWKTRRGLMVDRGDVVSRIERRGKAIGRVVVPVQMSVHGGENERGGHPDGLYPQLDIFFIFPSCNIGFKQNKPKSVCSPDSLPSCEAGHPF
jgi:hypothetical protein